MTEKGRSLIEFEPNKYIRFFNDICRANLLSCLVYKNYVSFFSHVHVQIQTRAKVRFTEDWKAVRIVLEEKNADDRWRRLDTDPEFIDIKDTSSRLGRLLSVECYLCNKKANVCRKPCLHCFCSDCSNTSSCTICARVAQKKQTISEESDMDVIDE